MNLRRFYMRWLTVMFAALTIVANSVPAFALDDPHLNQSQPNRIELSTVPTLYIYGSGFDNAAHPDRALDMHWFVRRDDTPFQACTTMSNTHGPHDCALTGWSTNNQIVKLGSFFSARAGYVELQLWRGHGTPTVVHAIDTPSGWSNVLRIPVGPVAKSQGDGPNRNPTPRPSGSVQPISVLQAPSPLPTPTMHQATGIAPKMIATPPPASLTAKTACPATGVSSTQWASTAGRRRSVGVAARRASASGDEADRHVGGDYSQHAPDGVCKSELPYFDYVSARPAIAGVHYEEAELRSGRT